MGPTAQIRGGLVFACQEHYNKHTIYCKPMQEPLWLALPLKTASKN